jgi:hypothetical protein
MFFRSAQFMFDYAALNWQHVGLMNDIGKCVSRVPDAVDRLPSGRRAVLPRVAVEGGI